MTLITNLVNFGVRKSDLTLIFIVYIRSLLENCAVVWHSSLTIDQSTDLERVQKVAVRTILGSFDIKYENALEKLNLQRLDERREDLCLQFAKKCTKNPKNENMFPKNLSKNKVEYILPFAHNERFRNSPIPYMARLLNKN